MNIQTHIRLEKNKFSVGETITIKFWIANNSKNDFKFCHWQTPLEIDHNANFLKIKYNGKEIPYQGKLVKRTAPTKEDDILLKPNTKIFSKKIINTAYSFTKKGKYDIQFIGRYINKLPNSNIISIKID